MLLLIVIWRNRMNYRDDNNKIPFYMTYPMQNMYLTEMEYEKDMERMKELYPREVHDLQEMVERRCDELEYEGSRIYDENPDRYMLEEEARRLYDRFIRENPQYQMMMPQPMSQSEDEMPPRPMPPRPGMPPEPRPMPSRPGMSPESRPMPPRPGMPMEPGVMPPRPGMPSESGSMPPCPMPPRPMPRQDGMMMELREDIQMQQRGRNQNDGWLGSLIRILFHNEIYRRRCRNRRCRRWW